MTQNLFELPELPLDEELTTVLAGNGTVRVERIVSTGQTSGWYDQEEAEFVALLQGEAELAWSDGGVTRLQEGDTLTIPPHRRHQVSFTSVRPPCVWLCVFWRQGQSDKGATPDD
ncbi:hypothetical protein SDC9_121801 [bioreactor metagenome]|uniref:Cupin type-2 domain-containing protein n=1 Tax=bioreactor metagenome TaxID=1076179 RepID=A0A645CD59_9ZZZZ